MQYVYPGRVSDLACCGGTGASRALSTALNRTWVRYMLPVIVTIYVAGHRVDVGRDAGDGLESDIGAEIYDGTVTYLTLTRSYCVMGPELSPAAAPESECALIRTSLKP